MRQQPNTLRNTGQRLKARSHDKNDPLDIEDSFDPYAWRRLFVHRPLPTVQGDGGPYSFPGVSV